MTPMTPMTPIPIFQEFAHECAKMPPGELQSALSNLAGTHLFSVLYRADARTLSQRVHEKPELCVRVIHAICALGELSISQAKLELKREQAKAQQIARDHKRLQLSLRKPIFITRDIIKTLDSIGRDELRESAVPVGAGILPATEPSVPSGGTHACVPLREAA